MTRSATRRRTGLAALTLAVTLAGSVLTAVPAVAAASVTVTSALGGARASLTEQTPITVSGSGFQSIQGGFGGIYVLFGWVEDPSSGSWRPSNGGRTGVDYLYVPDTEARDNQGFQRFVTFPGSGTAAAANGGELAADGSWSLEMIIPGAVFEARDRDGNLRTVDCRESTCGVITVGAHGVVNANNETFTPVTFVDAAAGSGGSAQAGDPDADTAEAQTEADGEGEEQVSVDGPATVGVEQATIIAGRVLGFTGRGFAPGEQVLATLGAGEAGAGPMTAGRFGEVAGALTLPPDVRPGTHVLRLEGAGSGQIGEADITVMADPAALAVTAPQDVAPAWSWAFIAAVVAASVLLVVILSSLVTALVRRRRGKRSGGKAGADVPADARPHDDVSTRAPAPAPAGRRDQPGTFDDVLHGRSEPVTDGATAAQEHPTQEIRLQRRSTLEAGV